MSRVTEIPVHGIITPVVELDTPAEKIDTFAALADHISGNNTLINWDFTNPVDRNQGWVIPPDTEYFSDTGLTASAGTVSAYTTANYVNATYGSITVSGTTYYVAASDVVRGYVVSSGTPITIDNWHGVVAIVLIEEDGIRIKSVGTQWAGSIRQIIPNPSQYVGKTVTVSALIEDFELGGTLSLAKTVGINSGMVSIAQKTISEPGLVTFTTTIPDEVGSAEYPMLYVGISNWVNGSVKYRAAKLELGTEQTLAHQEDGQWVLNAHADYDEEYLKCLMYDRKTGAYMSDSIMAFGSTLTNSDDLDNVRENGIYQYATASLPANVPFSYASILEVFGGNSEISQKIQRVTQYGSTGHVAMRTLVNDAWTDWTDFLTSAGGTVNGNLMISGNYQYQINNVVNGINYRTLMANDSAGNADFALWNMTSPAAAIGTISILNNGTFYFAAPGKSVTLTVDELIKLKELANA